MVQSLYTHIRTISFLPKIKIRMIRVNLDSTFTDMSLRTVSSPNGVAITTPGGSLVSNIILANILKFLGSSSADCVVSIPRSLWNNQTENCHYRKSS
jgi:hypothetical protein